MSDDLQEQVRVLLAPPITAMGYDLVRVRITSGRCRRLQVMVERADRNDMTVEDCAAVSRAVSAELDVGDPVAGAYDLEVSSPGIDRPLIRPADFERFSGFEAKIELRRPIKGRKRLRGILLGLEKGDMVSMELSGSGLSIPHSEIREAKLILTESLIEASRVRRL